MFHLELLLLAAGGGGGGNNGNSGCDNSANGGSGGAGALVTANLGFGPNSITWTLGQGGQPGFNVVDGFNNGTGSEPGEAPKWFRCIARW